MCTLLLRLQPDLVRGQQARGETAQGVKQGRAGPVSRSWQGLAEVTRKLCKVNRQCFPLEIERGRRRVQASYSHSDVQQVHDHAQRPQRVHNRVKVSREAVRRNQSNLLGGRHLSRSS